MTTAIVLDLDALEAAAKAAAEDNTGVNGPRSTAFLVKTNDELDAWMRSFYSDDAATENYRLHCLWAWQEQERRHAPVVLELINRLRAAQAIASARIVEVHEDSVAVALVGDFKPEHHTELNEFHRAIRRNRAPNTLVLCISSPLELEVLDEERMRAAGWVRAPRGEL
jgi:hypothetical protein